MSRSAKDGTKIGQSAVRHPLFFSAVTLIEGGRMWINMTFGQKCLINCNVGLLFVIQSVTEILFCKIVNM